MFSSKLIFLLAAALIGPSRSFGFTTVENSTSIGFYRDFRQDGHSPLYHSWSLHGYYGHDTEATLNIYLNNDFTAQNWGVYLTQAEIDAPLVSGTYGEPRRRSRLKLGRQIFTEGFDFTLLDGVQMPLYWSPQGGAMPIAGILRSPDVDQPVEATSPLIGVVVWQKFSSLQFRGGATARDEGLSEKNVFSSFLLPIESAPWSPQLFYKEERLAETFGLRQVTSEILLSPRTDLLTRLSYSELSPRPIRKRDLTSFLYRLFSISPTRSAAFDVSWDKSASLRYGFGATQIDYNSKFRLETANRQEMAVDIDVDSGRWISFVLTRLEAYGGNVYDGGTHFTINLNDSSQFDAQYDLAYLDKIDGIRAWAHHLRTGYKRELSKTTTAIFGVEGERNQYFQFDLRTMLYVANIY